MGDDQLCRIREKLVQKGTVSAACCPDPTRWWAHRRSAALPRSKEQERWSPAGPCRRTAGRDTVSEWLQAVQIPPVSAFRRQRHIAEKAQRPASRCCQRAAGECFWMGQEIHARSADVHDLLPSMDRSFFPFGKVFPQKDISPETRLTFPGSTPMIDCAINVLPDPVSPMRAKLSPGKIWKETPQTSSFSVRSSFAATTPLLYCKIGFSKFPSESTFLHSPCKKELCAVSYETLCYCVGIRRKYIQSYFNIGFHLEEASGGYFSGKILQGCAGILKCAAIQSDKRDAVHFRCGALCEKGRSVT